MLRTLKLALLVAVLAMAWPALAAGSKAVTSSSVGSDVTRYAITWTSDGAGAVSGNLGGLIRRGYIYQVQIVPGAGGVAPSASYDITLLDAYGVNLLVHGSTDAGLNLSATAASAVQLFPAYYHDGTAGLELTVANAGASKSGTVILLVRVLP